MLSYSTGPGDLDRMVADGHAVVERQLQHLAAGRGDRRVLADQVSYELARQTDAEERVLCPALARTGAAEEARHLRDENRRLKELLVVIQQSEPGDPEFEEAVTELITDVRQHAAEEEDEYLPRLRHRLGPERMPELGRDWLAAMRAAPARPHPYGPAGALGHRLTDPAAAVVDRLRDRVSGRRDVLATDPSGLLDPQAQRLMDAFAALHPAPLETLTVGRARRRPGLAAAVRALVPDHVPEPVGDVRTVPMHGGPPLRVYHPSGGQAERLPVIVWAHGGGWVLPETAETDTICRALTNRTGAIVVCPEYRLAPENPFPAAFEDVRGTYHWLERHAQVLGGDPGRIALAGESTGATMAAATAWNLRLTHGTLPVALLLVHPLATIAPHGDSMISEADAKPLTRTALSWMLAHAVPPDAGSDPWLDLLSLPAETLTGLPPTLLVTADRDVLRDQAEALGHHLATAGVPVTTTRYPGVMHGFLAAIPLLDAAQRAVAECAAHLRRAFAALPTTP
ncbi:alpha/beta hydrolase fold domain-containing protein [Catenuloplanes atrovinosus]|uniref:Acetyl esterase/lipase n=1 Tax=Catenuloplanes atrovinosus TaxID=137266 RepID=A0AAE4C7J5_9ACTN|nr:alpha/beta hydrolase fold domain-containing protein [Catenuloplanes atrovinosus]MDR7274601.1 acetyl esterase/lipase [Catenuloplanes atrovinosus]